MFGAAFASCPRDIAVLEDLTVTVATEWGVSVFPSMKILDVENNVSLGTITHGSFLHNTTPPTFDVDSLFMPYDVRVLSTGNILTACCKYPVLTPYFDTPCKAVGFLWSTVGEKLKELPGLIPADNVLSDLPNHFNHFGPIAASSFISRDGDRLLTKDQFANSAVSIRDAQTFDTVCDLTHDGAVRAASFDGTGSRVLTVSETGDVTTWSSSTCSKLARMPYSGNHTLPDTEHDRGSVAWAADDTLVAVIESNTWFEDDGDEGFYHVLSRLIVYDAATGTQLHSTDLGESQVDSDDGYGIELYSRGGILAVAPNGGGYRYGFDLKSTRIFNVSDGVVIQDFSSLNFTYSSNGDVVLVDVDSKGERLLVASSIQQYVNVPTKTDVDGIWDVATGELSRALWLYKHNSISKFVGDEGRRVAVSKSVWHAHRRRRQTRDMQRMQIVDVETDKVVASSLGILKDYATVKVCDVPSLVV